ncbi:MAG: sugar-transfer associated ATP-grasp domain-containing protein, partial [Phoenicibacter congonensis]|nr:sugar-transfer associated ATP-grasp domain-containing protein [Phoenicibacter congonensis]
GGWGMGFNKLSYIDGTFCVGNKAATEAEVRDFVTTNRNYLYTEFFHPAEEWAKINPVIHTLRILMLNEDGVNPTTVASYFRFAVSDDSGVTKNDDSKSNFNLPREPGLRLFNVPFDPKTGTYGVSTGKPSILLSYNAGRMDTDIHPDSGTYVDGKIEEWSQLEEMLKQMAIRLAPVEWLGYDLCMTDKGPKLMEINSHSGCTYLQMFTPYRKHEVLALYFEKKLAAIDALDEAGIRARNGIPR